KWTLFRIGTIAKRFSGYGSVSIRLIRLSTRPSIRERPSQVSRPMAAPPGEGKRATGRRRPFTPPRVGARTPGHVTPGEWRGPMSRTVTVAQHTVAQLAAWGVRHVFGVAGDTIIPLLEALRQRRDLAYIGVRHEESAGFMASAYAKLTGLLGVCIAEAGPAAVHLLSGAYDAHMDRVPVLALTGESATERLGTHWPQTINQQLLYADATCFNHTLATERQLPDVLYQALRAAEIQPGVSRLGLPVDLQLKPVEGPVRPRPGYLDASPGPDPHAVEEAARLLSQAERPLIFVGQGGRGQGEVLAGLADCLGAAIINTLPAKDVV